ncbi:hypothetical protein F7O43_04340 [Neisseria meningitidis]|nr:hypothetical protein [Neisseria meningitidis]MBG8806512.1 hypothetical protein [Neisseria meningitidis]MBG8947732.1 hypothetical protein [Neisseria meningitidis]MBJ7815144.1 hypothetical protein [Neisseria meningitidis]MCG8962929.1 hypothetical protein [Neisseria meningitidis]
MPEYSGFVLLEQLSLYSNSEIAVSSKKYGITLFDRLSGRNRIFTTHFLRFNVWLPCCGVLVLKRIPPPLPH